MQILKNQFWAFIPARAGSKKIKNKNLIKLKGKPLIAHSIIAAKKNKYIKNIIFSSDSKKYIDVAKKYGCKNFDLRPKKYSGDKTTDYEVFKYFLYKLKEENVSLPEFIVHLRPTTPLRKNIYLNLAIKKFLKLKTKYTALRSVTPMSNPSYKTFRIKSKKLCAISQVDYDLDKYNRPKEYFENTYLPNGYIDIFHVKNIFNGFLHGKKVLPFIVKDLNSDIDDWKDYISIKKIINDK